MINANEARLAEIAVVQQDIHNGPHGRAVGAFFDFDGAVVQGFGRVGTSWTRLRQKLQRKPTSAAMISSLLTGLSGRKSAADAKRIHRLIDETCRGRREEDLELVEDRLFTRFIAGRLYPEAWQLIRAHLSAGHTVVITTAAVRFQIRAAARELGVNHVLCTEPAVTDGVLTGDIDGEVLWGSYKAEAVEAFARSNGIELADSYAYSNGGSDAALLSVVGNPIAVNPDRGLASLAARRDWPVLRFRSRGRPGPYRIARSLFAIVGFCVAAGAAVVCSLGRDQRTASDRICVWCSTATLRGAGLRLRVTGAEHLRAPRPAVFVFNHQSQVDTFVIPCLLRTAFTGVVTKKAKQYPMLGRVLRYAGVTFIDHSSTGQGRNAVESLIAELNSNVSVGIAPEGRVSATPQLLPFKKGAFHLAVQARVPLIPIVIRNSGEALWRSAAFVRPGTIDVAILEPIDVSSWSAETLDQHIEQLRARYLDTLIHWPQPFSQRPNRRTWWAIRPTRRSGDTNISTPTLPRIPTTPQQPVDLDAEAV